MPKIRAGTASNVPPRTSDLLPLALFTVPYSAGADLPSDIGRQVTVSAESALSDWELPTWK